ncbi:MAG: putative 2-aminoethylphosphonate ABC transporter permease subunit [Clostridiales bacterium]|nr:putative 2-aminoethylphosphonate ABC transporter permease subunit [Clostridiales bacterium]
MKANAGLKRRTGQLPVLLVFGLCTLALFVIMVLPLITLMSKAFQDSEGSFAGLQNYVAYFSTPTLANSLKNTAFISTVTALASTLLGFAYAYALTRSRMRWKGLFRSMTMLPLFMPTVVHALALIYLFGKQGIITRMGLDIGLYGATGIILAEIVYTFPSAVLMFSVALSGADGRLYEAADSMGIGRMRQFFRITLPQVKYTLVNALFVCFTLAFTDFGAPKVLGGSYNVLATDIYKQIAGQFNMNMGAVVGTLLLLPAVLSYAVDQFVNHKGRSGVSSKATPIQIKADWKRDGFCLLLCGAVTLALLALVAAIVMGAVTEFYPYNRNLTLQHFQFKQSTGGMQSFVNSIVMSVLSAVFGTVYVFGYGYLMEKTEGFGGLKRLGRFLSSLPVALPGIVIGLSFIFFFNNPYNPLNFLYGTMGILVLANLLHFYSVPYITATSAVKKLDKAYESVAQSMKIPGYITFLRVSVPLSLEAILEVFMYFFMNSMVTVSALVFLYTANTKIASIAITHMEEAGDIAQAAAMSLLIIGVNLAVRILYECLVRRIRKSRERKGATL